MIPSGELLTALGAWAVLFLAIPKRELRTLAERLRQAAQGSRVYVLSPPNTPGPVGGLVGELTRAIDLGIPMWLLALAAEARGQRVRQVRLAEWVGSAGGVLYNALRSRDSAGEIADTLQSRGFPVPAGKAHRPVYSVGLVSSARLQPESQPPVPAPTSPALDRGEVAPPVADQTPAVQVMTMGGFRLLCQGADVTAELLNRPILAFVWIYLLARSITAPGVGVDRQRFADELHPRYDSQTQRARLRKRLHELHRLLPEPVASLVRIEPELLRFAVEDCVVDVLDLLTTAHVISGQDADVLSRPELARVTNLLERMEGEFLPEWDELERKVTEHRGTAGDAINRVRALLDRHRAAVLGRLGRHYLAIHDATRAVRVLERACEFDPEAAKLSADLDLAQRAAARAGPPAQAPERR
jgi:hypothetical protein